MPITRTPWVDDDGTGTTGTIINNAEKQALYNQIDALAGGVVVAYAPIWSATAGTVSTIGNGTLVGNYVRIGQLLALMLELTIGSTTSFGTGVWTFGIPIGAVPMSYAFVCELYNSAVGSYAGAAVRLTTSTLVVYAAGAPNGVNPSAPFTFKAGDRVLINGTMLLTTAAPLAEE